MEPASRRTASAAAGSLACAAVLWWTASGLDLARRPALAPADARALWEQAHSARGAGRLGESLSSVRRLLAASPGEPRYLGFQAEVLELARRPLDAARSWELFIRVSPAPADACPALGRDYVLDGRSDVGLDADQRCLALDPSKTDMMVYYALALERAGREAEAETFLKEALKQDPEDADASVILVRLNLKKGALDEAARIVGKALATHPRDSDVLLTAARVSEERGDLKTARTQLEAALSASPGYADVYRALGRVLMKDGDTAGSQRALSAAADIDAGAAR
jgi:tetratricopeptide (TPR) repeat protein